MSENKNKINNNEIISFTEEENQIIDTSQNKVKKEINIDEILKKEDDILKKNIKLNNRINSNINVIKNQNNKNSEILPLNEDETNNEIKNQITEDIRETSRRIYLNKRVNQQFDLFKRRIIDENNIFQDVKLTKEEINNNKLNSKIYHLINKNVDMNLDLKEKNSKDKKDNIDLVQRYSFKSEKEKEDNYFNKNNILNNKKTKRNNNNDFIETSESLWEKEQRKKAILKYGNNILNNKYDLLIENQTEFIKQDLLESENISLLQKNSQNFQLKDVNNFISERDSKIGSNKLQEQELLKKKQLINSKNNLPIYEYKQKILDLLKKNNILIIEGETGSGKTTQIPQYLYENGYCEKNKKICITQPRRVAAMSVASRVAYEMGVKCGHEVGYAIRFEENISPMTKIIYMTDGILLRYLLSDNLLQEFSVLIIDEAHERSIQTDIIFGIIKTLIQKRTDLKIIISSATLSNEKFINYFNNAVYIKVPGRRYPVDIYYTKSPEADYIEAAVITALQIHISQAEELFEDDNKGGDILVFLTGQEEIELAKRMINNQIKKLRGKIPNCVVLPIYAALPSEEQSKIFLPVQKGERKIILATNIAETSITINGIGYVIDSGFCKQICYDPRTGLETLAVTPISKANANQRAGRAGRVRPGKCFRLYTANTFKNELEEENIPEIQRNNLINMILLMKSLGINNLLDFDFMDSPPHEILIKALELLYALGALNSEGILTQTGLKMIQYPIDPSLTKCLLAAYNKYNCFKEMIIIVSMLSIGTSVYYESNDENDTSKKAHSMFENSEGDHLTLLNIYHEWEDTDYSNIWCTENYIHPKAMQKARNIKEQLEYISKKKLGIDLDNIDNKNTEKNKEENKNINDNIRKSIISGFFFNSACLNKDGIYRTIKNPHVVNIHPNSALFKQNPKYIVYHELIYTSKEYMRYCIEVEPEWLLDIAPFYFNKNNIDLKTKVFPKYKK
jgi:pre-mRNA-splicing factor ATP-dependent RNA helicase DHX16